MTLRLTRRTALLLPLLLAACGGDEESARSGNAVATFRRCAMAICRRSN